MPWMNEDPRPHTRTVMTVAVTDGNDYTIADVTPRNVTLRSALLYNDRAKYSLLAGQPWPTTWRWLLLPPLPLKDET